MSELKLQGGSSGSSTYIIQGGAGDTNRTFTLPNVADATLISSSDSQTISTAMLADSVITTDKVADANITAAKLDGGQTGSAPAFVIRAWVFFNGTGTVAINNSGNVSSITDNGTGDYTVNFTTALPTNYGVAGFSGRNANPSVSGNGNVRSTSAIDVTTGYNDGGSMTFADVDSVSVVFYG